jgi:hypothetical protein
MRGNNNKKFYIQTIFMALLVGGVLLINGHSGLVKAGTSEVYKNMEILTEVIRQIEKSYVEPQDAKAHKNSKEWSRVLILIRPT